MTDLSKAQGTAADRAIWVPVCRVTDIPFDAGIAALINENTPQETQIALFRPLDSDTVYAISNFDPFSEANVLGRGILCSIGEQLAVASPVLKQHFSLTTGQCFEDADVFITTYPVRVNDGTVFVDISTSLEAM